jgi:hypothetical protein
VVPLESESRSLSHLISDHFRPLLAELRSDRVTPIEVYVEMVELADRWVLVMDESGAYHQPYNHAMAVYFGQEAARFYGRVLAVRMADPAAAEQSNRAKQPKSVASDDDDENVQVEDGDTVCALRTLPVPLPLIVADEHVDITTSSSSSSTTSEAQESADLLAQQELVRDTRIALVPLFVAYTNSRNNLGLTY